MIAGGVANLHDAPTWKLDSIYNDNIRRNYEGTKKQYYYRSR